MLDPKKLKYMKSHEWLDLQGDAGTVGISDHAQKEITDVVFIEPPKVGRTVKQGEACCVVESVKAAFDIYAPVSGTISRVNDAVSKSPQTVNQDCYGAGWLFAVTPGTPADLDALMTAEAYSKQLEAEAH